MTSLEQQMSQRGLVQQAPSAEAVRGRAREIAPRPIRVFYGETYDPAGHPIDSLKYYLFVANIAAALIQEGFKVDPVILVADTAACRNVKPQEQDRYMRLGDDRARFVEHCNRVYAANLRVVRMSEYIHTPEFVAERDTVINLCQADGELMERLASTVPESKLKEEQEKGYMYSFDEVATILDVDLKVGPPREDLYDSVARAVASRLGRKELMSLFLTPTLPLGKDWSYFFSYDDIELHGITAYKAGSKQLQKNRIIIGRSDAEAVKALVADSYISTDPALPNPVLDVGIIAELARQRLEGRSEPVALADDYYSGRIGPDALKALVAENIIRYVLEPLS